MRVHMKNGRGRVRQFAPVDTRRDLEDMLDTEGFSLETERTNHGEWNDGTNFFAVKGDERLTIDRVSKGDRRNWQAMWNDFCNRRGLDHD